jgi:hypothetical protein
MWINTVASNAFSMPTALGPYNKENAGRIDPPGRANEKMTRCKGDRLEPYHLLTSPLQSFSPQPLSLPQALMPSLSDHHACAAQ